MKFPSKFTTYEESLINHMVQILESKVDKVININILYKSVEKKFNHIDDFVFALDALYALGYVEINSEDLIYVSRD